MKQRIFILGGGGWGTALACSLAKRYDVKIWTYEHSVADEINNLHTNSTYLPNIKLDDSIIAVNDFSEINNSLLIVNTIPTQFIRKAFADNKFNCEGKTIVNGSKGIEKNTLLRVSQIFEEIQCCHNCKYAVLSGPSHAEEVARSMPTAVVAASNDWETAKLVQEVFSAPSFRVYTSDDVIGTEIGGALKNVIAIAAGIIDGLQMGDNTKAALITRGIAELQRLGVACGARPWTFSGLSGLGDLFVTCNSRHSRNRKVGELIGQGNTLVDIMNNMKMVAEGVVTTDSALNLGNMHKVDLPITEQVYNILFNSLTPQAAISELMTRESKHEWGW